VREGTYAKSSLIQENINENEIFGLLQMAGLADSTIKGPLIYETWDKKFPGSIQLDPEPQNTTHILKDIRYFADFLLEKKGDSLFFMRGPISSVKFAPASLDSPACNFGRMPGPPKVGDMLWKDSLLVAIGDSVVLDGFYYHIPWANTWGKAIIEQSVIHKNQPRGINFTSAADTVGQYDAFNFLTKHDEGYSDRHKCKTKAESMWDGEYKLIFTPKKDTTAH
jgi:hypothetical protein